MNKKDAYKQKIEAELELLQANLDMLKAKAKNANADMQINYTKEIETVEKDYSIIKSKLNELGEMGEGGWEHLKEGIESSWNRLREYVKKTSEKIDENKKDIK
jgi:ElaB/YqjD/DUF883 family membrane-anchored ribosome-binding protein